MLARVGEVLRRIRFGTVVLVDPRRQGRPDRDGGEVPPPVAVWRAPSTPSTTRGLPGRAEAGRARPRRVAPPRLGLGGGGHRPAELRGGDGRVRVPARAERLRQDVDPQRAGGARPADERGGAGRRGARRGTGPRPGRAVPGARAVPVALGAPQRGARAEARGGRPGRAPRAGRALAREREPHTVRRRPAARAVRGDAAAGRARARPRGGAAVILGDEPFGALDAQARELLQNEVQRVWARLRRTDHVPVRHAQRPRGRVAGGPGPRDVGGSRTPARGVPDHAPRPRDLDDVLVARVVSEIHGC